MEERPATAGGKSAKGGLPKWLPLAGLAVGVIGIGAIVLVGILVGILRDSPDQSENGEAEVALRPTETALATEAPTPTVTETPTPTKTSTIKLTPTAALGVGSTRINAVDGAEMVYVAAGDFLMGSEDAEADDDEAPEHTVYLDDYWIYKYEVTNEQFADFLNEQGNEIEGGVTWLDADDEDVLIQQAGGEWAPESGYGDHPVVEVSSYGAQAYCEWAGGRLPTEAEWEKAARGSEGLTYPWGSTGVTGNRANFCDVNCDYDWKVDSQDDGFSMTAPVGSFPDGASPYGALDMVGNVWEWVADWYDEDYYQNSPSQNPTGPASGTYRILRGGSWYDDERRLRASNRSRGDPDSSNNDLGFRCLSSP
jgi:serine/threonine-protein kinase